jgi:hypothetical protein
MEADVEVIRNTFAAASITSPVPVLNLNQNFDHTSHTPKPWADIGPSLLFAAIRTDNPMEIL